jgi:DNA-binding response OmpR family regulator
MSSPLKLEVVNLSEVPGHDSAGRGERPVVLVVDDEMLIADTLSMILTKNGYRVLTAYDAKAALKLAQTVAPEVLLTDVAMLPEMNGMDLAIEVAQSFSDCRVLLLSGQASAYDLLDDARERGHEFTLLKKPLHPLELLKRVKECTSLRDMSPASLVA